MKKIIILMALSVLTSLPVQAGSFKKYGAEFMNLGVGGRSLAMGGAGTAIANDVTASYWNPAGLTQAAGLQIEFMHTKQFISSIQQNYLGLSSEYDDYSTISISLFYLTTLNNPDTRNAWNLENDNLDYSKVKRFSTGDYTFLFSYGRKINDKLSVGVNAKGIYRDYEIESAFGVGFDAGAQYRLIENLTLGAMLRDITTTMISWSTGEKEFITPSVRLGATYRFLIPAIDMHIQPAADVNILFEKRDYAAQVSAGAGSFDSFYGLEVGYNNIIAVRAGIDDLNRFNTGVALQIPIIRFDYSFTAFASELGDIHRISFHLDYNKIF